MIFELGGGGNKIVQVLDKDGDLGFDKHGQLWAWTKDPHDEDYRSGTIIGDVRGCTCYICGQGWELTAARFKDQHWDGDRVMHDTCLFGHRKLVSASEIRNALMDAGYLFKMEEVPPRYPYSTPWQRVTVMSAERDRHDTGYRVVLGRRKRVWEIRVHKVGDLSHLFEDVNDTKGYSPGGETGDYYDPEFGEYYYVHAYTIEKMVDYLTRMRNAIPVRTDRNNCD